MLKYYSAKQLFKDRKYKGNWISIILPSRLI